MARRKRHVRRVSCPAAKRSLSREAAAFRSAVSKSVSARNKAVRKCGRRRGKSRFSYYRWARSVKGRGRHAKLRISYSSSEQPMLP